MGANYGSIIPGEWVRTPHGVGLVSFIEDRHATSGVIYTSPVHVQINGTVRGYKYIEVFRLSFLEFVFNGPHGRLGFGLSRWWEALLPHLFAILVGVSSITMDDIEIGWRVFGVVFALALPTVIWIKTYHNFTRQTV